MGHIFRGLSRTSIQTRVCAWTIVMKKCFDALTPVQSEDAIACHICSHNKRVACPLVRITRTTHSQLCKGGGCSMLTIPHFRFMPTGTDSQDHPSPETNKGALGRGFCYHLSTSTAKKSGSSSSSWPLLAQCGRQCHPSSDVGLPCVAGLPCGEWGKNGVEEVSKLGIPLKTLHFWRIKLAGFEGLAAECY